jgi:hypothetical protein
MVVNSYMVLRLFPHLANLNPEELIWTDVKQWLRADNTTLHINDIKHICEQGFKETQAVEWNSICEHVEKLEKRCYEEEGVMDNIIEMIVE